MSKNRAFPGLTRAAALRPVVNCASWVQHIFRGALSVSARTPAQPRLIIASIGEEFLVVAPPIVLSPSK